MPAPRQRLASKCPLLPAGRLLLLMSYTAACQMRMPAGRYQPTSSSAHHSSPSCRSRSRSRDRERRRRSRSRSRDRRRRSRSRERYRRRSRSPEYGYTGRRGRGPDPTLNFHDPFAALRSANQATDPADSELEQEGGGVRSCSRRGLLGVSWGGCLNAPACDAALGMPAVLSLCWLHAT